MPHVCVFHGRIVSLREAREQGASQLARGCKRVSRIIGETPRHDPQQWGADRQVQQRRRTQEQMLGVRGARRLRARRQQVEHGADRVDVI